MLIQLHIYDYDRSDHQYKLVELNDFLTHIHDFNKILCVRFIIDYIEIISSRQLDMIKLLFSNDDCLVFTHKSPVINVSGYVFSHSITFDSGIYKTLLSPLFICSFTGISSTSINSPPCLYKFNLILSSYELLKTKSLYSSVTLVSICSLFIFASH